MNPHLDPQQIELTLERVLLEVERPARYIGGEYNSITKQWTAERLKVALCFPDIYDLGTPNLGLATLYQILNRHADLLAERVFLPWVDMEAVMQREGLPLYSLESKHPVQDFDMLGISLPYEQLYTNTLHLLHLSGMPLLARDRLAQHYPLVVAGGHATYNPEPMADFIDAFVIGEGEEAIVEIARTVLAWRAGTANGTAASQPDKRALLQQLAALDGVYVPMFYEATYNSDGTLAAMRQCDNPALP